MKKILTIAGSDSGGGAGIQQDLKVFSILGSFGCSVVTALTAQNTKGVFGIYEISPEFIENQLKCVLDDIRPDTIKTGMLFSSEIIMTLVKVLKNYPHIPLIVDPVMIAKGGEDLLKPNSVSSMKDYLLPIANVITPNIPEAEALTGNKITNLSEMKEAALILLKMIKKSHISGVVIKGGHLEDTESPDLITTSQDFAILESKRIKKTNTHGTGCTFSAGLAHYIGSGLSLFESARYAKELVSDAIKYSVTIGDGIGPTNPYAHLEIKYQRNQILEMLDRAINILKSYRSGILIPEIQSNLGYALIKAEKTTDVAAFPGRIIRLNDDIRTVSNPAFGASSHIARIILTVMKKDPEYRSAMNIRFNMDLIDNAIRKNYIVAHFNREFEPEDIKTREGSTLNWGIESALNTTNTIPDFIYDTGGLGKEPVIRVLGKEPIEVVGKALIISGLWK